MAADVDITTRVPSETASDSVRARETASLKKIQAVYLDLGVGSAEAAAEGTVPVSGTVAVTGALTDAQLRASAVPVSAIPSNVGVANSTGSTASVTTAVTLLAAFAGRRRAMIMPTDGAIYMSLGGTADNTAALIPAGTPVNLDGYSGAINVVAVTGTVVVSRLEY
jgi:hypothetical protein